MNNILLSASAKSAKVIKGKELISKTFDLNRYGINTYFSYVFIEMKSEKKFESSLRSWIATYATQLLTIIEFDF